MAVFLDIAKSADFRGKNADVNSADSYIFWIFFGKV